MSGSRLLGDTATGAALLKKHFPYVHRGPDGEFIIPATHIDRFVRKYMELADHKDHLDHLKMYRNGGGRPDSADIGD
jgi:hypothetical protein